MAKDGENQNLVLVLLFETVLAVNPKSKFIQGEIAAGRMKILALKPWKNESQIITFMYIYLKWSSFWWYIVGPEIKSDLYLHFFNF